ncbi:hypothetical protein DV451_004499 [Geotrichum candidum]|uniref:endo-polygalacturonase n=1 Tax=Geotrichum candidum TaxID=1173061 RepID=A0A0J9X2I4_GEOCN|nr:hypothetical protein DV451_004499 [Geotrichum candidum]KAI9213855.1 hypothetical protein DS838_001284 [Geotrichum bryndzae]KAF5111152.1 hypothetical protein DV453_000393 [Geotrichum candidum]KAF5120788.1 hypothetical protein DV452_001011 [Geotrichum candidum]KAF5132270.1 hypothetical protein DV495_001470 [Geotrichum candidum]
MLFSKSILLSMAAALAVAAPTESEVDLHARASCTFTTADQAISGKKSCSTIVLKNIAVPAGKTLDLSNLNKGTTVIFDGTTTFGYKEWVGPLIKVSGDTITVKQNSGAKIDCAGSRWWDGKGGNGGKKKPKFFAAHGLKNSKVEGLKVYNTPVQAFSISGAQKVNFNNILLDNKAGDSKGGHNTDAFDVGGSSDITIDGAIVYNQDDCIAVNSGNRIKFLNGFCSGGHGLSIGSVGGRSNNVVDDVLIKNSKVVDSDNGVRIKTVYGATGKVNNVRFEDITLDKIVKKGLIVQQDYENGKPTGNPTNGIPVTNITFKNVQGNVLSKGVPYYLLCGKGSCSNWTWSQVKISGGKVSDACKNYPSNASCK